MKTEIRMVKSKMFCRNVYKEGISIDPINNFRELDTLLRNGLQVVAICNDGSGRSRNVADELNRRNILSARLEGGLNQFLKDTSNLAFVATILTSVPNIAVILVPDEYQLFNGLLTNLRAFRYSTSDQAIASMTKIIQN